MTRFFVNGTEISPPPGITSLSGILKHVENGFVPPGNVIREVQVDGVAVPACDREDARLDLCQCIEGRKRIDIITGSLKEIACESVREAVSYLDRIEGVIPSLASSFQAYPGPEAFSNLRELYSGFYWLVILMDRLKSGIGGLRPASSLQEMALREHQQKFIPILKRLVDSQEKQDFVLIADLLEYEILPLLPVWKCFFSSILPESA